MAALAEFNRGAALLEQYKYADAAKAFGSVLEVAPHWKAARFNLGVAYFNMHGQRNARESLDAAREAFEEVLAADPGHLHALFCLGLYYQYFGENEKALEHFAAVYRADGEDPYVAYKYAEALIAMGQEDEGTETLEKVVALDPGFVSAVYRLALQYQRARQPDRAMPLFERFKQLNAAELAGGTFIVQKAYGTVGKYYRVLGADNLPLPVPEAGPTPRIVFSPEPRSLDTPVLPWNWAGGSVKLAGLAAGDVDGDGDLDLCLTALGRQAGASLYRNDGTGRFTAVPLAAEQAVSPCFGDVDNDGDLDLWLGGAGSDLLLENDGQGTFSRTASVPGAADGRCTTSARLLDVDSDGDLDLLAFRLAKGPVPVVGDCVPAATRVHNNNRDGSFTDLAAELGLAMENTAVGTSVYDDFDNDRDLDLVLFPAGDKPPVAWVNDRANRYRILDAADMDLPVRGAIGATSGDPNKDGNRDLLVLAGETLHLYLNRGGFRFEADEGFADRFGRLGGTCGQFVDMDNDGDLDIVIADAHRSDGSRGPVLLINDWPRRGFLDSAQLDPGNLLTAIRTDGDASCVAADFTGNGKCDVLLAPTGKRPLLLENLTPGGHWIALDVRGTRPQDKKSRSNGSAIGARVEIKAGSVFQQFVVGVPSGPVAMPPLRIHAGLGQSRKVDWLRILWPDAVLQAELELPGDRRATVTEHQRKTSSCPVLFAWNGSRFEFVADFGGVGGLGYLVARASMPRRIPPSICRSRGWSPSTASTCCRCSSRSRKWSTSTKPS